VAVADPHLKQHVVVAHHLLPTKLSVVMLSGAVDRALKTMVHLIMVGLLFLALVVAVMGLAALVVHQIVT
jgi:hypothetical protein